MNVRADLGRSPDVMAIEVHFYLTVASPSHCYHLLNAVGSDHDARPFTKAACTRCDVCVVDRSVAILILSERPKIMGRLGSHLGLPPAVIYP